MNLVSFMRVYIISAWYRVDVFYLNLENALIVPSSVKGSSRFGHFPFRVNFSHFIQYLPLKKSCFQISFSNMQYLSSTMGKVMKLDLNITIFLTGEVYKIKSLSNYHCSVMP